jgi:hypothetical protein
MRTSGPNEREDECPWFISLGAWDTLPQSQ